jgi:ATP-dependent helicase/nuclease subunit A
MLPASLFTEDEAKRTAYAESKILMQGVIDCVIEDSDGILHLIDYKTDRLTKKELEDKSLAQKALSEKHSLQLYYYALAVEKIFGKRPDSVQVYSLPLGETVDI